MFRTFFLLLLVVVSPNIFGDDLQTRQVVVWVKNNDQNVSGVRIRVRDNGTVSPPTDLRGRTVIRIPETYAPGTTVSVELVNTTPIQWVRTDATDSIRVPTFDVSSPDRMATIEVVRRGDLAILRNPFAIQNSIDRMFKQMTPSELQRKLTREQKGAVVVAEARRLGVPPGKFARVLALGMKEFNGPSEQGRIHYLQGDAGGAISLFTKAIEQASDKKLDDTLGRGQAEYVFGDFRGAASDYRLVLAARPNDDEVMTDLAIIIAHLGHYRDAQAMLLRAIELIGSRAPRSPTARIAYLNLAWICREQADFNGARDATNRAFEIAKQIAKPTEREFAETYEAFAALDDAEGRYDDGLAEYGKAMSIYQRFRSPGISVPGLAMSIASNRLQSSHLNEAKAGFEGAERQLNGLVNRGFIKPDHPIFASLHNYLGGVDDLRHDFPNATREFQRALDILKENEMTTHPLFATFLNNMAKMYVNAGDDE